MTIGVLALQGDFEAHQKALRACGVEDIRTVRDAEELESCDGLVIPGGESTVMSRLCDRYELWQPLQQKLDNGMGAFGTCAGLIFLSRHISGASQNFQQKTLGALDVDVARNAYGAQVDSFEADLKVLHPALQDTPLHAVFIRAPLITRCGSGTEVLASHGDVPVVVRHGNIMAASFHPEISGEIRLHRLWLESLGFTEKKETPQHPVAREAAAAGKELS